MGRHKHHDHGVAYRTAFVVRRGLTVASYKVANFEDASRGNKTPVQTDGPQRPGTNSAGDQVTFDEREIGAKLNSRPGAPLRHSGREFAEGDRQADRRQADPYLPEEFLQLLLGKRR